MTNDEIFAAWVPDESVWSRWAKPVLFAHLDAVLPHFAAAQSSFDLSWVPPASRQVALVVDLPGDLAVRIGVALAQKGYRPVPLYNALPVPFGYRLLDPMRTVTVAAVDVLPIMGALCLGASELAQLPLAADAPPAFLLDTLRQGSGRMMRPDDFDNRSVSFTTDFPSANFLASRGIARAVLLQQGGVQPLADLAHTLRRWQDGGIAIELKDLDSPFPPARLEVNRPTWYRAMFQRALVGLGLRRAPAGGFGAWVPGGSAGG